MERKGKERKGKERKGKERKGKERKGKERKGKEKKRKEKKKKICTYKNVLFHIHIIALSCFHTARKISKDFGNTRMNYSLLSLFIVPSFIYPFILYTGSTNLSFILFFDINIHSYLLII